MSASPTPERHVLTALDRLDLVENSVDAAVDVVAVVGPAGSGKTTAVHEWLRTREREHVWIDLTGPETAEPLAAALAEQTPGLLVLDDSDHLHGAPHLQRLVDQAVDTGWKIIVTGRSGPPTAFWRLVGRGRAAMAGFEDLLLAPEAVVRRASELGAGLTAEQLEELHRVTLGWPALVGIVLNEALGSPGPVASLDFTEAWQYVRAEVIETLHPDLRSYCTRVALLGTFTAELAQEVLQTGSDDQLNQVWRSQAMLVRVAADTSTASPDAVEFTFPPVAIHALLRDLAGPGREEAQDLHRRAALWYEARGDWDRALPHMLRASPTDSVRQLGRMRAAMEPQGRSEETLRWFGELPQRLRMQPAPVIGLILALVQAGLPAEARQLIDQVDTTTWERTDQLAELAMVEAMVERMLFHHGTATAAAERSLALLDDLPAGAGSAARLSYLRVMAIEQLREVRLWEGDTAAVRELMDAMRHDVIRSELQLSLVHSTAITAMAALDAGDLATATEKANSALRLAERRAYQDTHLVAEARFVLAAVALEHDKVEPAIEQLEQVRALAAQGIFPTTLYRTELVLSRALARNGRTGEAWAILEDLGAVVRRTPDEALAARLLATTAVVHLHAKDGRAARAAHARLREMPAPPDVLRQRALLASRFDLDPDSLALADELAELAEPINRAVSLLLRARALRRTEPAQALDHLVEALRCAEELDLWHTVLDLTGDLGSLMADTKAHADLVHGPGPAYLRRIATTVAATSRKQSLLSEREAEIAQFLPTRKSNAQIAAELYISENTVKTHVRHIYEKLGVDQRDDAIGALRERGLLAGDH